MIADFMECVSHNNRYTTIQLTQLQSLKSPKLNRVMNLDSDRTLAPYPLIKSDRFSARELIHSGK